MAQNKDLYEDLLIYIYILSRNEKSKSPGPLIPNLFDSDSLIIMIMIIIALKGGIRDSVTISSIRREPSPARTLKWPRRNRVQITCNTSSAYHVQHVVIRATWCEGTAQLLSFTELKSQLF